MSGADSGIQKKPKMGGMHLLLVMCALVVAGGCNSVLVKVTYTAYGDHRAFFVNQAITLLSMISGGIILIPKMLCGETVTAQMRCFPKRHFLVMGFLDGLGCFFTAVGTSYTPGSLTPLLNQLLIPFTMVVSVVYLQAVLVRKEVAAAALIMLGACLSVVPSLLSTGGGGDPGTEIRWYAVVLYAMSNLPMAASACYKELSFGETQLDVWYVTQWVCIFQFLVGFLFMPLQALPGFGSSDGMPLSQLPGAFMDGLKCYVEIVPECADNSAFLLLTGFCAVNMCYNIVGLYLTKHGSAVLNALSYSLLLPFTICIFFTPLLGRYQEQITWKSIFTLFGLVLVLIGFAVYQRCSQADDSDSGFAEPCDDFGDIGGPLSMTKALTENLLADRSNPLQPSFNTRTLGMIRVKSGVRGLHSLAEEQRGRCESNSSRRISTPW